MEFLFVGDVSINENYVEIVTTKDGVRVNLGVIFFEDGAYWLELDGGRMRLLDFIDKIQEAKDWIEKNDLDVDL